MAANRNEEFIKAFGKRLRELRKAKGMTQEELAGNTGIELRQYGRIERGEINTTINTASRLADALEIHVRELFDFEKK